MKLIPLSLHALFCLLYGFPGFLISGQPPTMLLGNRSLVQTSVSLVPSGCSPSLGYEPPSLSPDVLSFIVCLYRTSSSTSMKLYCNSNGIYGGLSEHNRVTENTITRQLSSLSVGLTTSQTQSLYLHCQQNYV